MKSSHIGQWTGMRLETLSVKKSQKINHIQFNSDHMRLVGWLFSIDLFMSKKYFQWNFAVFFEKQYSTLADITEAFVISCLLPLPDKLLCYICSFKVIRLKLSLSTKSIIIEREVDRSIWRNDRTFWVIIIMHGLRWDIFQISSILKSIEI